VFDYDFVIEDDYLSGDDCVRIPLQPASLEELDKLEKKLYETSCRVGQKRVAELLSYLFGKGECAACNAIFSVSEQIIDMASELPEEELFDNEP
jgi:hypothetical protein